MSFSPKEIIVVVGYGWVGQANALALSHIGYHVCYYDVGEPKCTTRTSIKILMIPSRHSHLPLRKMALTRAILCVSGDRVSPEGEQNIEAIKKALESLHDAKGTVVLRSTVLPASLVSLRFDYYVPEFLHEKKAVEECMAPQYFIVGSRNTVREQPHFFNIWQERATKIFYGTPEEASYLKYLSNTWNALRIAFVNEFGNAMALPTDQEHLASIEKVINFFFEKKAISDTVSRSEDTVYRRTCALFAPHSKKRGKTCHFFVARGKQMTPSSS